LTPGLSNVFNGMDIDALCGKAPAADEDPTTASGDKDSSAFIAPADGTFMICETLHYCYIKYFFCLAASPSKRKRLVQTRSARAKTPRVE